MTEPLSRLQRWALRRRLGGVRPCLTATLADQVKPTYSVNTWQERWSNRPSAFWHSRARLHMGLDHLVSGRRMGVELVLISGLILTAMGAAITLFLSSAPVRGWIPVALALLTTLCLIQMAAISQVVCSRYLKRLTRPMSADHPCRQAIPTRAPTRAQRRALAHADLTLAFDHLAAVRASGTPWCRWDQAVLADLIVVRVRQALDPSDGKPAEAWAWALMRVFPWLVPDVLVSLTAGQRKRASQGNETASAAVLQRWWPLAAATVGIRAMGETLLQQWGGDTQRGQPWPDAWKRVLCQWLAKTSATAAYDTWGDLSKPANLLNHRSEDFLGFLGLFEPVAQEAAMLDAIQVQAPRWMPLALRVALDAQANDPQTMLGRRAALSEAAALAVALRLIHAVSPTTPESSAQEKALAVWLATLDPDRLLEAICAEVFDDFRDRDLAIINDMTGPIPGLAAAAPRCGCPARLDRLARHVPLNAQARWVTRLPPGSLPQTQARVRAHALANRPASAASSRARQRV